MTERKGDQLSFPVEKLPQQAAHGHCQVQNAPDDPDTLQFQNLLRSAATGLQGRHPKERGGISWPLASWVTYILSQAGLVRSINRNFPLTFNGRGDAYPVAGGNWTQLTISLANFDRLARSHAGLWVLSTANCDDKAMDTLRTSWKSNWEISLRPSAFHSF